MSTLQDRIETCMRRNPGVTQADMCRATGAKSSSVSAWVNGPTKSLNARTAAALGRLFGCDRDWLAFGAGVPNWTEQQASLAGVSVHPVAQPMSLTPFDTPPTLSWEKLMQSKELPARFVVAVPDAAIASEHVQGTEIVFDLSAPPKVGKPVIVQDRSGLRYLRIYGNVRGTRWQALATSVGHATLDSEADGLVLLASAVWIAV